MARERTLLTENMAKLTPKYKILRVKKPYINFLFSRRIPNQAWMGRCETVNIMVLDYSPYTTMGRRRRLILSRQREGAFATLGSIQGDAC